MHPYVIRLAEPVWRDATRLHALEAATLGDSDRDASQLQALLARPEQRIYLAEAQEKAVGFLATFETASPHGCRWELDMLGVAEAWRRRGIGTALVRQAIADGLARGISLFRAVVAEENRTSAALFARCGFVAEEERRDMLVYAIHGVVPQDYLPPGWCELPADAPCPAANGWPKALLAYRGLPGHEVLLFREGGGRPIAGVALLAVQTVACSALWMEAHWVREGRVMEIVARAAVERAKRAGCDEVGMLLAANAGDEVRWALLAAGMQSAGSYRVWTWCHEDQP